MKYWMWDEVMEEMYQNDELDTFPSQTKNIEAGSAMIEIQNRLRQQGFVEWYTKKEKGRYGKEIEYGRYRLTQKAKKYIQQKRKAGLNRFNVKRLSQVEWEYIQNRLEI